MNDTGERNQVEWVQVIMADNQCIPAQAVLHQIVIEKPLEFYVRSRSDQTRTPGAKFSPGAWMTVNRNTLCCLPQQPFAFMFSGSYLSIDIECFNVRVQGSRGIPDKVRSRDG